MFGWLVGGGGGGGERAVEMTIKTRLDERKGKPLVDIYKNLTLQRALNFSSSSLPKGWQAEI